MKAISRLLGLLILGITVLSLVVACGGAAAPAPSAEEEEAAAEQPATEAKDWPIAKDVRICHVINVGDPYSTAKVNLGAKESALFGFTYDVYDMENDIPTEIRKIEDCIAKEYDVIILVAYDPTALNAALKKAQDAGIPVIVEGGFPDEEGMKYTVTKIGSDGYAEGASAGDLICKTLQPGEGWAMIEGGTGHPIVAKRSTAVDWVEENCPDRPIVARETGQWNREKARTVMENMLTAHPGEIQLVYCHNDDMCLGAAKAVQEAGLEGQIKVVGVDGGNKEVYDAIRSGLMYGTILNDCSFIATNMIQVARDLVENRPILKEYISPATQITPDNVDNFTAWW